MIARELDLYWKTVVNTIRDGIMIVNTGGAIVSVNKAFEKITGYSREEIIGQTRRVLDCDGCGTPPGQGNQYWCDLFRNGSLGRRRCRMKKKDGNYIHVLKNSALFRDSGGTVIGAVGTVADLTEIIERDNQLEAFRRQLRSEDGFYGIIGASAAMQQVFHLIENAAHSDAPVIICGESGTGKELASKAIHAIGGRGRGPFIKVNCASLTESLLESELFGHVRGAYTGAYKDRKGRFEKAAGGDIFLDEIGDLPLSTQVKLLRVLEEKTIERVGSSTPIVTDVRIISATNRDLTRLVEKGGFRKDLYFRINVIPLFLPPLRNRSEDIPLLAEHFFQKLKLKSGKDIRGVSKETMAVLMNHDWPGNVRELKSVFEYAFVICSSGMIRPHHLPETMNKAKPAPKPAAKKSFDISEIKKRELIDALKQTRGNQSKAADILGVSRVTVWNRMKRYGINAKRKIEVGR